MKTGLFWLSLRNFIVILFLFLTGTSFVLAKSHYHSKNFWNRLLKLVLCAGAISVASYFQNSNTWIFFGILHLITFASLLSPLLILIPTISLIFGVCLIILPHYYQNEFFFNNILVITGLSPYHTGSGDFAPLAPWFGVICVGIFFGWIFVKSNFNFLKKKIPGLTTLGQHALLFYMLHQLVLYPIAWSIHLLIVTKFRN